MPGSTPATSQLDWLISTTAMIVLSGSNATRDLIKACPGAGRGRSAGASGHSVSYLPATMVPSPSPPAPYHLTAGGSRIRTLGPPWSKSMSTPPRAADRSGMSVPSLAVMRHRSICPRRPATRRELLACERLWYRVRQNFSRRNHRPSIFPARPSIFPVRLATPWSRGPRGKQAQPPTQNGAFPSGLPRRMKFNDRRALAMLTARIAALETQIAELNVVLAHPDLYARDPARFGATTVELAAARDELAVAEEQWLRLEMLREEIETAEPGA